MKFALYALILTPILAHADLMLVDPTTPIAPNTPDVDYYGGVNLQAIFYSPQLARVIINGQTYELGDNVNNYKILKIQENSITLQGENGILILPLLQFAVSSTQK